MPEPLDPEEQDFRQRLARKQKLNLPYESPYDRPIRIPQFCGRWIRRWIYTIYWIIVPILIIAVLLYLRSMLAPFFK